MPGRDLGVEAAALDGQREGALHLLAGAHAARADDALRRIEGEVRVGLVLGLLGVVLAVVAVAHVAQADGARHVLQLAVAVGGAGQAVERMVGDVELHHALADLLQPLGLGRHHHARRDRRGAGGGRAGAALRSRPGRAGRSRTPRPMSVAQSLGTWMPASIAARMIEVPAGTVTGLAVDGERDRLGRLADAACRSRSP